MSEEIKSTQTRRLQTAHLVVGYAMSRLDRKFLAAFGFRTFTAAFAEVGRRLEAPPNSIKGLRDEFDPLFPGEDRRRGWADRKMNASRVRVADELAEVSDEALIALVDGLLHRVDEDATAALDALAPTTGVPAAAAERLLTGRKAEQFVIANSELVLGVPQAAVLDMRESMLGFDFRLDVRPEVVVEVKGLREPSGQLLFTDREWREANLRRALYWLVVVADLGRLPKAELVRDPADGARVAPVCRFERTMRPVWRAGYSVAA